MGGSVSSGQGSDGCASFLFFALVVTIFALVGRCYGNFNIRCEAAGGSGAMPGVCIRPQSVIPDDSLPAYDSARKKLNLP